MADRDGATRRPPRDPNNLRSDGFDLIRTDRAAFDCELDELISSAAASTFSSSPPPRSKRTAPQDQDAKRVRTEHISGHGLADSRPLMHDQIATAIAPQPRVYRQPLTPKSPILPEAEVQPIRVTASSKTRTTSLSFDQRLTQHSRTFPTLNNTVRRQWDPRKDDLSYDFLLQQRRRENLRNVDRYVPGHASATPSKSKPKKYFLLERLPGDVKDRIFTLLLVNSKPIEINLYWLRSFVRGHSRVPTATQSLQSNGSTYVLPVPWTQLVAEVEIMKNDMAKFKQDLVVRGFKTKSTRSPARGLSTALLRVSHSIHKAAARIFYGQNTFRFSCSTSAFIQLESFLATIGPVNVANLRSIAISAPLWHRGIHEDYVEGTIMDLLSPASRLAVVRSPGKDRLLSSIQYSVKTLLAAGNLSSFSIEIEHGMTVEYWCGVYVNAKRLISTADAEDHVLRKYEGVELLKQLSQMLAAKKNRPMLSVYHNSKSVKPDKWNDKNDFYRRMTNLMEEAEKYGWQVDPYLREWW